MCIKEIFNKKNITEFITYSMFILLIWTALWSIFGKEVEPPKGSLFFLIIIYVFALILGRISSLLYLPELLGMLVSGFIFGNSFDLNLNEKLSSILRELSLAIILLRAGLNLNPNVIKKLYVVCLRLAFIPCIVEATTVAIVSHYLLDFPFLWGFLLGFVLSAVSPAVVVPGLISLQERYYGTDKGIPTVVIASASIDDVLAITGFGVCLSLAFNSSSSLVWDIFMGPIQALIGVIYGIVIGIVLWFIPSKWNEYSIETINKKLQTKRLILLLLCGIVAVFGSTATGLGGAGALGCLVGAFVAALKWRENKLDEPIAANMKILWLIIQPFLFSLIGSEVKISELNGGNIGYALIVIFSGLAFRSITAVLFLFGANFNIKEKFFISFAWLSKATVQAAIGPIALGMALRQGDPRNIELGHLVLTFAVLAILVTAPLGAILIKLTGTKLLTRDVSRDNTNDDIEDGRAESEDEVGAHQSLIINTSGRSRNFYDSLSHTTIY